MLRNRLQSPITAAGLVLLGDIANAIIAVKVNVYLETAPILRLIMLTGLSTV